MPKNNPQAYEADFDVPTFLSSNGLTMKDVNPDGSLAVESADGELFDFNPNEYLAKEQGIDPAKVNISINTPDDALAKSPVGLMDRWKLEFGNERGSIKYLKNNFDDVIAHPDKGLLVKNKGVWQQVDPTGVGKGDPWEIAKELAADTLELSTEGIDTAAGIGGAGAGTFVGGPIGTVGGAIAASGAAAAARTSLGRYIGTYDATPEEQLRDVGVEALLALGGEAVGVGVKAIAPSIKKAVKNVNEFGNDITREAYSKMLSFFTGAKQSSTDTLMRNPDAVIKEADNLIASVKAEDPSGIVDASSLKNMVGKKRLEIASEAVNRVPAVIGAKYDAAMKGVMNNPKINKFTANVSQDVADILAELQNKELIQQMPDGTFKASDDWANAMLENPEASGLAKKGVQKKLTQFVEQLDTALKLGEVKGKKGAEIVKNLRSSFDAIYFDAVRADNQSSRELTRLLGDSRAKLSTNLANNFDNAGLGKEFRDANAIWSSNVDMISKLKKMQDRPERIEAFINSDTTVDRELLKQIRANDTALGQAALDRMDVLGAGADYAASVPNFSAWGARSMYLGMGMGAATGNPLMTGASGLGLLATAPKNAAKLTKYLMKASNVPRATAEKMAPIAQGMKDTLLMMSPGQKQELLSDPEKLGMFFGTLMQEDSTQGQEGL